MAGEISLNSQTSAQLDLFGNTPVMAVGGVSPALAEALAQSTIAASAPAQEGTPSPIQDAGEELTYNRRNRVRTAKGWGDIAHLNDALKVKEAIKSNVWPKPDYKQLIEDGMQPMVAHIVKQVYDSVAVKPAVGSRELLNDAALQRYISSLNRIEQGLMTWATDPEAVRQWASSNARTAGAMLGRSVSLSELANEQKTLLESVFPGGWKNNRADLLIAGGNKLLGALQPGYTEINRAIKAVGKGWPEKREAWEIQGYRIVENPKIEFHESAGRPGDYNYRVDDIYIDTLPSLEEAQKAASTIQAFVLFNKRKLIGSFASEEEAVNAAKDRTRRDKGNVIDDKGARVESVEREGIARRLDGEDISSERLMEEFGFRGVNFGNWMKTPSARAEAQLHLNHAFDSFHDLADILGVPPKALSLNGLLGLAIGAQGRGGSFAAHFVPGVNEINITRTSGAGSLAHEWAHALDHYFASQAGFSTSPDPFLTEYASLSPTSTVGQVVDGKMVASEVPRFDNVRPEVIAAFSSIVDVMDKRMQTEEEAASARDTALVRAQSSVENWLKAIRRDFVGQEEGFDALAAKIRTGDVGDGKIAVSKNAYISPVVSELRDLYKAKHGRLYSLDNIKGLQAWVDHVAYQQSDRQAETSHVPQKVSSEFAKNARHLDKEKGGKPYWSTKLEKFARAFDAFVSDELEARHARNDYLSHTGRDGLTVPMGDERKAINTAFKTLINEIQVKETEKGFALCSVSNNSPEQTMPVSEIHKEITRLKQQWPRVPNVTVVGSVNALPFSVQSNADGVYYDGQVYVVADNIYDLKQLQKVMAHECILHHSLEEMLGDYGFAKLHSGIQTLKKDDPIVSELAEEVLARYGVLSPEEETREIVARAGERCLDADGNIKIEFGFMKSVFAGVANWLRDRGFKIPVTNIELQGLIHDAGQWIHRGQEITRTSFPVGGGLVLNSLASEPAETKPSMVQEGIFSGRVLSVVGGVVEQKVGRGNEVVFHDSSRLSMDVVAGEVVHIGYRNGIGHVLDKENGISQGR